MSAYSKINIREIEDGTPAEYDQVVGRFGRKPLESEHIGVSLFTYEPNFRGGGHRHGEQEEAYVVVGGSGRMLVGEEIVDLALWDTIRVAPETARGFEAGPDGLELIAVGGPKPEGGDGEMVEGAWEAAGA